MLRKQSQRRADKRRDTHILRGRFPTSLRTEAINADRGNAASGETERSERSTVVPILVYLGAPVPLVSVILRFLDSLLFKNDKGGPFTTISTLSLLPFRSWGLSVPRQSLPYVVVYGVICWCSEMLRRVICRLVFHSRHGAIHCIQSQWAPRPRRRQNGDRGAGRSRHTTFGIFGLSGLAPVHRL